MVANKRNKNIGYIYMINCKINNKKYVGATRRNVTERWCDYINAYHRGYFSLDQPNNEDDSILFDMLKYGITSFTFEILEVVALSDLFKKEREYILKYDTVSEGYNHIVSQADTSDINLLLKVGKSYRFKKGAIPHNAIPIKASSNKEIIEFNSFNEAGNYIMNNKSYDIESLTINQVVYKIKQSTLKNKECFGFYWTKEGFTDFDYKEKEREYKVTKFLVGETYKNNKGYEFEIIGQLKNNKRKIKFINTGYETISNIKEIANGVVKDWESPCVCGVGIVGKDIEKPQSHYLYDKWRDMLRRCFDENIILKNNGKFTVCNEWLRFINYINDIETLDNSKQLKTNKGGWRIKLKQGETHYSKSTINIIHIQVQK